MKRFRHILPIIVLTFLGLSLCTYIRWYDGIDSTALVRKTSDPNFPFISDPGKTILFNTWEFNRHKASFLRLMLFINAPALVCSKGLIVALAQIDPQFGEAFPHRLSYFSYILMLSIPFIVTQWWLVGAILDRWLLNIHIRGAKNF